MCCLLPVLCIKFMLCEQKNFEMKNTDNGYDICCAFYTRKRNCLSIIVWYIDGDVINTYKSRMWLIFLQRRSFVYPIVSLSTRSPDGPLQVLSYEHPPRARDDPTHRGGRGHRDAEEHPGHCQQGLQGP